LQKRPASPLPIQRQRGVDLIATLSTSPLAQRCWRVRRKIATITVTKPITLMTVITAKPTDTSMPMIVPTDKSEVHRMTEDVLSAVNLSTSGASIHGRCETSCQR